MPDIQNRGDRDFSEFDAMTDAELQQILREDTSKPEGEGSDMEMMFYVMEVLAKRREKRNEGKDPADALESFKRHYYTENENSFVSERAPAARKRCGSGRWRRGLVAAAAILVLVIATSVTANALGFDLWGVIAKWTQETFHFGYAGQETSASEPGTTDAINNTELRKVLSDYHVPVALAPTWIPDGYEEGDVRIVDTPTQRQFIAVYHNNSNQITIWITDYLDTHPKQVEQSDLLLEVYTSGGVDYYIFNNYDQLRTVWVAENYECYISGPISVSEIKEMIDSIGKG